MSTPRVVAEGVWKKFRRGERHDTLKDALVASLRSRPAAHELQEDDFWSVRDLSFTVEPGQALGIIGGNGAGKSTTLKLLTRILRPTKGSIRTHGRVGALIEVAAGFHPDLTGRENVFLQGAIMGMKQREIQRHFDDIVSFAGIETFIDTPVKRYSSGMNARLGFAIAASLNPDILVIDEVLAVGDIGFQQKAFARLKAIVALGIPVVVVSHQLDRVVELCNMAILLKEGRPLIHGSPAECIREYVRSTGTSAASGAGPLEVTVADEVAQRHVEQGTVVSVPLSVRCSADFDPKRHYLGIRVRSAESGLTIMRTGSDRLDIDLRPGQCQAGELTLRMNTGAGLHIIETYGWDDVASREIFQVNLCEVNVSSDGRNVGAVYLEPSFVATA